VEIENFSDHFPAFRIYDTGKRANNKSGSITHDTVAFAIRTKDILKIRSHSRLKPGSDYHYLSIQDEKDVFRFCRADLNPRVPKKVGSKPE